MVQFVYTLCINCLTLACPSNINFRYEITEKCEVYRLTCLDLTQNVATPASLDGAIVDEEGEIPLGDEYKDEIKEYLETTGELEICAQVLIEYDENGECIDVRDRPSDKDACQILLDGGVLQGRDLQNDGLAFECDDEEEECDGVENEGTDDEIKTITIFPTLPADADCENTKELGEGFDRFVDVLDDVAELMRKRVERVHEKDRMKVNSLIFNAFIFMQVRVLRWWEAGLRVGWWEAWES